MSNVRRKGVQKREGKRTGGETKRALFFSFGFASLQFEIIRRNGEGRGVLNSIRGTKMEKGMSPRREEGAPHHGAKHTGVGGRGNFFSSNSKKELPRSKRTSPRKWRECRCENVRPGKGKISQGKRKVEKKKTEESIKYGFTTAHLALQKKGQIELPDPVIWK